MRKVHRCEGVGCYNFEVICIRHKTDDVFRNYVIVYSFSKSEIEKIM